MVLVKILRGADKKEGLTDQSSQKLLNCQTF